MHEIMNDNAMFSVGDLPWHKLGKVLDIPPSTEEALELAELNWKVHKQETYIQAKEAEGNLIGCVQPFDEVLLDTGEDFKTGYYCTYRIQDDMPVILGHVSSRYEVLQNIEAFQPFDEVLLDAGYTYETAGAVKDGKRVWILAKAPESALVGDDKIEPYVLLFNSHDGSTAVIMKPTIVRVVCNNTLEVALKSSWQVKIKHTTGVKDRLDNLTKALSSVEGNIRKSVEVMNMMTDISMGVHDATEYFENVFPKLVNRGIETRNPLTGRKDPDFQQAIYDKLLTNFVAGRGNKGYNLWHAYNAVTEYVDHNKSYKDWVESVGFGWGSKVKLDAFTEANNLVSADTKVIEYVN